jgi:hypothetical protein
MSDVASLEVRVSSDGVALADQRLQKFSTSGAKAERATSGLAEQVKRLAAAYLTFEGARRIAGKIIEETAAFEKLRARLVGVSGSVEDAEKTFRKLQDISQDMVYSEAELADTFLELAQAGLDPSERSLRAFANIAADTGVGMDRLGKMVLSASMGIFETMKAMGIKGQLEGNKVRLTYKGITTEMSNSAQEIQNYLVKIGEIDFSGGAKRQLDTVSGAVTMLHRTWNDMFRDIGRGDLFGDSMRSNIELATSAIRGLTESLAGGGGLNSALGTAQIWATYIIAGFQGMAVSAKYAMDIVGAVFTKDTIADARKRWQAELEQIRTAGLAAIQEIEARMGAKGKGLSSSLVYEPPKVSKAAKKGDGKEEAERLAKLRQELAERQRAARDLAETMASEEEKIRISYEKRADIIAAGTADGSAERAKMVAQSKALYDKEKADLDEKERQRLETIAEAKAREREEVAQYYLDEQQQIDDAHRRRFDALQKALQHEAITRQEYNAAMLAEDKKYAREREEYLNSQYTLAAGSAEQTFASLAEISKRWGGEQSAIYAGMFAMSKSFANAQAGISIATGLAKAQELGWPANLAEYVRVAATGAQILATIAGTNYSGSYDKGGFIPAGRWGIAGERGPEIVQGPAQVTSRRETAQMLGGQQIQIVNAPDMASARQFFRSSAGKKMVANIIREEALTIRTMSR